MTVSKRAAKNPAMPKSPLSLLPVTNKACPGKKSDRRRFFSASEGVNCSIFPLWGITLSPPLCIWILEGLVWSGVGLAGRDDNEYFKFNKADDNYCTALHYVVRGKDKIISQGDSPSQPFPFIRASLCVKYVFICDRYVVPYAIDLCSADKVLSLTSKQHLATTTRT